MAAGTYDLLIEQGATFLMPVQLSSGGPVDEGGTALDISGCEIRMQIRKKVSDATPLLSASTTTGEITITSAVDGQFQIELPEATTAAIAWTSGVYDLELETVGGYVKRYLQGKVKVSKEVTR